MAGTWGTGAVVLALAGAGCAAASAGGPIRRLSGATARVQVFTEPAPVRALVATGSRVVALVDGELQAWDAASGALVPTGLVAPTVATIAQRGDDVWAVTADELIRLPRPGGRPQVTPLPAELHDAPAPRLAIDDDGQPWIATQAALYRLTPDGAAVLEFDADVTALVGAPGGGVVVGTTAGLRQVDAGGAVRALDAAAGSALATVRGLVRTAGDDIVAIGDDDAGRPRLVLGPPPALRTVRLLPDVALDEVVAAGADVLVRAGAQLLRLGPPRAPALGRARRGGARVVAVDGAPMVALNLEPLAGEVPAHAVALAAAPDGTAWVGTAALGIAQIASAGPPVTWLRAHGLVAGARDLSVACAALDDCWLATGATAWRWRGGGFTRDATPAGEVIAVLGPPAGAPGAVRALQRAGGSPRLTLVAREAGDATWSSGGAEVAMNAGPAPAVRFARRDHTGAWWLGWRAEPTGPTQAVRIDGRGVVHPLRSARAGWGATRDVAFDDDGALWLARTDGVVRLAPGGVTRWPALSPDAPVLGLSVTSDGTPWLATARGVARWDGVAWQRPAGLQAMVREAATTPDGVIWLATDRGVAWVDGERLRRVDRRRGLPDDRVLDLAIDGFGRVWARSAGAIVLVDPTLAWRRRGDQKQQESR